VIGAEVIADSVSPAGHRLTTLQVVFPRCILSEINTHRAFSRGSASSRAVPVRKMLEQVRADPFIPLRWQSAQPGMQGGAELTGEAADRARDAWLNARDFAARQAEILLDVGVHKTMPNRLLEPFAWHTTIISATDWDGFWVQRCSPLAELHMEATANAMRAAHDASTPTPLGYGEWHLPYVTAEEQQQISSMPGASARMVSAARCARVSYLTHDGQRDLGEDVRLFEKLVSARPAHWSPLEHQATPAPTGMIPRGNFTGFEQHRHRLEYGS
jgi:hypothetical protein